ncbi:DUF6351 family protein [Nocardiopsis kunsanensis]|uniref:DUF6351 family protein n=1 Tax=Nocardiopsis kunsanensis TaxID=141693 RepID=UPI001E3412E1|nr:DUF6351 family protein [Nocardiopsis kunsanensis]
MPLQRCSAARRLFDRRAGGGVDPVRVRLWGRCSPSVAGAAVLAGLLAASGTGPVPGSPATAGVLPSSAAPFAPAADRTDPQVSVSVLSSRPDTVTGGRALVRVEPPASVAPERVRLSAAGVDVTDRLRLVEAGGNPALEGLLTGLAEGESELVASVEGGGSDGLTVVNHPVEGPVFSGPHQEPFLCDTDRFEPAGGGGATLGPALDEDCSARTVVRHVYRDTDGRWHPLPGPGVVPSDADTATTAAGTRVPFVARVETGTVNRSVYETAVLHTPEEEEPDPWTAPRRWNGRLVYKFGGGCTGGWYVQGPDTAGVLDAPMLERGYAVASASLNVFGNNCNDLLAAETMSAVHQRFVTTMGVPHSTLGWGNSGGAYQAHQIADNYPGLLDGIVVSQAFPDVGFSVVPVVTDALLLREYAREHPGELDRVEQHAVSGFLQFESIDRLAREASRVDPRGACRQDLPEEVLYHPEDNPGGARCEVFAATQNVYGTDPQSGLPRRPLDNVGVQYGLHALVEGVIDTEQFLHLNEHIGGLDADGALSGERTEADQAATEAAYRSGRLLNGGGGLADVPVVDHRFYEDDLPGGDLHMRYHSFSVRERLEQANGTADNHVMLVEDKERSPDGFVSGSPLALRSLVELDAWVSGMREQQAQNPRWEPIDAIRASRPGFLQDSCWIGAGPDAERVVGEQVPLPAGRGDRCADAFPVHTSPRIEAGGPLASDVVACALRPFDAERHPGEFTEQQAERAEAIFSEGVCDWDEPGRGQQGLAGTWQRF